MTVEVGASVGIAIDSAAMRSVDDLLGDADVAMYQAKALGKGRYHVFDACQRRASERRLGHAPGSSAARPSGDRRSRASSAAPRLEPEAG